MNPFKKKKKKVDIIDSETSELIATTEIETDERGVPINQAMQPNENPTETEPNEEDVISAQQEVIEDLKAKLEVVADREFERQKEELAKEGIDVSGITEPEQLEQAKRELKAKNTGRYDSPTYASGAYLGERQRTGRSEKGYESYPEMLKDLRKRERLGDKEAKRILEALWKKARTLKGLPTEPSKEERKAYHEPTVGEGFYKVKKKGKGED